MKIDDYTDNEPGVTLMTSEKALQWSFRDKDYVLKHIYGWIYIMKKRISKVKQHSKTIYIKNVLVHYKN